MSNSGFSPRPSAARAMKCSAIRCWRGSSSRPASWTPAGTRRGRRRRGLLPDDHRRLPIYATGRFRLATRRAGLRARRARRGQPVLYDVSTLHFQIDAGDGFRETGFSKERRLDPQITIGLLTDAAGFPLMVNAFEGNRAETTTMVPMLQAFMVAHHLAEVTVVSTPGWCPRATSARSRPPGWRHARRTDLGHPLRGEGLAAGAPGHRDRPARLTQPWPTDPPTSAATRSSTTSIGPTGPGAPCGGSMSRSPRPSVRSPAAHP